MKRFCRVLKEIHRKLDLPQPYKSRILLEIGSDLEDMYQLYRGEGYNEQEAQQLAEEKFDISDAALNELARIHQSAFSRLLSRLSEQAQSRWEKVMLVTILLLIALFAGRQIFSTEFIMRAGIYIWPLMGISFITGLFTIRHVYVIYLKKDHRPGKLRRGLLWFLALGSGSLLTGLYGSSVETFRMIKAASADMDPAYIKIVRWAMNSSAMMILSLIWFFLVNRVKQIEQAETAWLKDM